MPHSNTPSRDRLEAILTRLGERRGDERVFMKLYSESARAEAEAADRRGQEGTGLGPLDGRIVSIKDLFDVAGEPTLAGSIIRRNAPPAAADATIVRRLRAAGAVIIGKTHMTEFAFTAVGLNPLAGLEASRIHADWLLDENAPVDARVKSPLRRRLTVPDAAIENLLRTRRTLIRAMDERLAPFDLALLPTTPIPAVPIASVEHDRQAYRRVEGLLLRNTEVANQFDLTAITLPMPGTALPAGLMLMARNGFDGTLLRVAASMERLLEGGYCMSP
ncbi:amidase family protein [Sinorhizobium americanum]|uniref:Amidase n=1 Tax=Sinorhizobium americanum TaxID=194963 RepID=A0A4R2BVR9_9HYPH|nr:amidase family protein [Sinorhizobium americanum]TCN31947.1 amidase [Sinorhizobium americanum]